MARWAMEAVRAHASVCKFKGLVRDLIAATAQNRCLACLGAGWRHDALLAETPCAGDPRVFPNGGYCAGGEGGAGSLAETAKNVGPAETEHCHDGWQPVAVWQAGQLRRAGGR